MAAADIPRTVLDALIVCGVDNVALFLGERLSVSLMTFSMMLLHPVWTSHSRN
jgi:hypothetical protein